MRWAKTTKSGLIVMHYELSKQAQMLDFRRISRAYLQATKWGTCRGTCWGTSRNHREGVNLPQAMPGAGSPPTHLRTTNTCPANGRIGET